jgi:tellurite resistance protein TehA-like permease
LIYCALAFSIPILTLLFFSRAQHQRPHRDVAATSWLRLGPTGTGSLGLMALGHFAGMPLADIAVVARVSAWMAACCRGACAWWPNTAVVLTLRNQREGMSFNLGRWRFTFPIGVYATATFTVLRLTRSHKPDRNCSIMRAGSSSIRRSRNRIEGICQTQRGTPDTRRQRNGRCVSHAENWTD